MIPKVTIKVHHAALREMGCVVSDYVGPELELHHCKDGSMTEFGEGPGMGQRNSDWLVIPLKRLYHTGALGIDAGIGASSWESQFGAQIEHLEEVSRWCGYNVFRAAGYDRDVPGLD